ncbi:hypothetical protein FJ692_25040 [Pseudomonas fluorescens]|nr:hypothetical protein C1751_17420 [Pseudomonas fluorescens]TPV52321.1 hypothetical protein FJ692_25040 [Pseudomonas fluorescens]
MLLLTAGLLPAVRAILDGEAFSQLSLRKQLMKGRHHSSVWCRTKCGGWLACDGGVSANISYGCDTAIAGKPAPTFG